MVPTRSSPPATPPSKHPSKHPGARPSPTRTTPRPHPTHTRHVVQAAQLPLGYATGSARQVITVVAGAESDTQGVVQAWQRVPGGWHRVGPAVPAWLGSDGMTPHPNESLSAVPMGSYTLTQAFGHDPNPGTRLRYRETTPSDWWISEPGPYYNTEQHCAVSCPFTQGAPNEHLYYEMPYYTYAAVIDYNTRNAPGGVQQGAGSAFFLHVAVGAPTQGCVAVPEQDLVTLLRWLDPGAQPRILIGIGSQ
jgi:L,D-peptidoglycan transpeptidase YkuD (ErfK/YbiS/YcfS/YnhG family)